jgi:hypothetical protein
LLWTACFEIILCLFGWFFYSFLPIFGGWFVKDVVLWSVESDEVVRVRLRLVVIHTRTKANIIV